MSGLIEEEDLPSSLVHSRRMKTTKSRFKVGDVSCRKNEGLIGGATISLFNTKKQLKTGRRKLRLWPSKEVDGSIQTTPGKVPKEERGELERLEKLVNKYERGQIQRVIGWTTLHLKLWTKLRSVKVESGANFLIPSPITTSNELVTVWDLEVGKINPSEHKQLKLARSLTRGIIDRDLKPSSSQRKILSGDERQFLWKFRFSLMSEKRALTKFLRCVEWSDVQEAKQAVELMGMWETIDACDALELLSPVFENEEVSTIHICMHASVCVCVRCLRIKGIQLAEILHQHSKENSVGAKRKRQ
ncbi:hypothetical protein LOK49_LG14G01452 [Camellia lanceoleosa]|uniref:Uncharacterized protein n=1 Tax=Camellia lanceoleosa TaxID=1840588 RepID=A0ACC0FDB5_9ERIC|nr:hypothetical protein LOK49_LG14G01452 [Camellia lanceoleosa]